ncbi:MAG: peptidylprolyl isomerase [Gammaproteobacteria bacterium]|nr:peptidylprolyl isomerase [Gammaproteobacteria bacterium]MBU2058474.1 peptidylprolyl isomerase [Gammaproteobacteria bacterium]MBU2176473.1 peptidylprolyl isomerase [Gammaproteobacteria bacterium]MBU2248585.1 peptidylprolyl isomerase [Gammaproteobacteria bacterium]MBU2345552.1 peptidylprolyl isomerase [Gammaproteobacteria bacterium]
MKALLISGLALALALNFASAEAQQKTATASETKSGWQTLPQDNLLYLDTDQGRIVILLAPQFAPEHVKRVKDLVKNRFYDGVTFYRVIEGFVAQFGVPEHEWGSRAKLTPMKAEFNWPVRGADPYLLVQRPDLLAEETGFNQGFAVAREQNQEWLVHCPGVVNMARANEADTAVADIAIMMGQAPRHLDKNMSAFGKVIWGQYAVNRVRRGEATDGGVIGSAAARTVIKQARLGSELAADRQLPLEMLSTNSSEFSQSLAERRSRTHVFYQHKGNGNMDVCYPQVPVRLIKAV